MIGFLNSSTNHWLIDILRQMWDQLIVHWLSHWLIVWFAIADIDWLLIQMFLNRLCRSVRKLFDKYEDKEPQMEIKSGPEGDTNDPIEPTNRHLDDCHQLSPVSEVTPVSEPVSDETSNYETVHSKITQLSNGSVSINRLNDWNQSDDNSEVDTEWYENDSRVSSVVNRPCFEKRRPFRPKDSNRLLEKWGESVAIFDENGAQRRLIGLCQLKNFFVLSLSSLNCSDCLILCALINSRYPRFYTSTVNYLQRWRMRYNIFVASDALIVRRDRPSNHRPIHCSDSLSNIPSDQLVVHIGELHLYFDVVPKFAQPVYVNSSFYANRSPINEVIGVTINPIVMSRISRIVNSIRYSKDIFQFKFPMNDAIFYRKDQTFDKFMERQLEFMDETVKVYRKSGQKKRRFHNWSQPKTKHRDYFAYDYDTKHFETRVCGGRSSPTFSEGALCQSDQPMCSDGYRV